MRDGVGASLGDQTNCQYLQPTGFLLLTAHCIKSQGDFIPAWGKAHLPFQPATFLSQL